MRKLASIQKILDIQPIINTDNIEVATVLGWKVVVKKGEYKVGDLIIYCEIDSLLPNKPEFEFLRKNNFRIRTIKLRNQISQGIIFPLSIISNEKFINFNENIIGLDVTELIGIIKYEAPIPIELTGVVKGEIPSFIKKTDEDRIQILPDFIEKFKGKPFIETEKLDGSSTTYYYNNGEFGVCNRNWEYYEDDKNLMWKFARIKNIEEGLRNIGKNIALQGEIIGEGIQKNKYNLKGHTVKFFRVFDIDKYRFFSYKEMIEILNILCIDFVPILNWSYILPDNIDQILERSNGKSVINPLILREGLVYVLNSDDYDRVSFKSISNKFLIINKE